MNVTQNFWMIYEIVWQLGLQQIEKYQRFLKYFTPYFRLYQSYVNNFTVNQEKVKEMSKNSEFLKLQEHLKSLCNGFSLESMLILPIQRLPRYHLLLRELYQKPRSLIQIIVVVSKKPTKRLKI
eukprot:UN04928